ncbi:MAG: sigma-70 family RNA polymerase sigma factor [Chloroflexi bacterium]|nr:sigma-70 family RNA polymerase sigma factor [Chloroflexota bacterium]
MEASSDRDLILRARRGDPEAFGELVRLHQAGVFNVCYRMMGERREAEDMAQEAFIRAYERINTFDVERPFGPWMRRVAANVCLNQLAMHKPEHAELDEERDADPAPLPESGREVQEEAERVRNALRKLPPHYRAVVELRHYQDLSYDEIAAELKIPLSDVKSHLFRARKILAESLSHEPSLR